MFPFFICNFFNLYLLENIFLKLKQIIAYIYIRIFPDFRGRFLEYTLRAYI